MRCVQSIYHSYAFGYPRINVLKYDIYLSKLLSISLFFSVSLHIFIQFSITFPVCRTLFALDNITLSDVQLYIWSLDGLSSFNASTIWCDVCALLFLFFLFRFSFVKQTRYTHNFPSVTLRKWLFCFYGMKELIFSRV